MHLGHTQNQTLKNSQCTYLLQPAVAYFIYRVMDTCVNNLRALSAVIPLKQVCHGELFPDVPAAIYRDDLSSNYVAYWLVEFNSSQYAVVSAGAQTGAS